MKRTLLALSILAAAISGARAVSVYSDNFDYSIGGLVANSGGAWVNNSGTAGSLLVTNVGANTLLLVSGGLTEDGMHRFPSAFPTNDPTLNLYASFQLTVSNQPSAAGTYFATFGGTNAFQTSPLGSSPTQVSGHRGRLYLSISNMSGLAPAGKFFIAIANSNLGSTTNAPWPTPLDVGATYTVVERLNTSNDVATLWINPSAEGDTSVTASDLVPPPSIDVGATGTPTNGVVNICMYGFRQATGEGTNLVDVLKVGTAFVDVAGANTAPSITGIATQSIAQNGTTGPISFTVSDSESAATSLTVTPSSSNPTLIGTGTIVISGTGSSRTVTLTPNSGQQGTATITLTVSDGINQTPTSFLLQVGFPSISAGANILTYSNSPPASTTVTVGDAETGAASVSVSNSWTSVNQSLVSSINVTGSGATRTVTVTPAVDQTGVATVTVYARDPQNNLVQTSFVVTVSPHYGIVLSDNFNYTDFDNSGLPQALVQAGGDHNSPWVTSSGTAFQMQVTNGVGAWITSSNTEDVAASLVLPSPLTTIEVTNGAVLYTSFTINVSQLPSTLGDYFAHFRDTKTGSTFRDKIFLTKTGASDPVHNFRVGIANAANNPSVIYPVDLNTNVTYTIVTRYNTGTGESVLWIAPTAESDLSVAATDATTANFISAYGLRESDFEGTLAFSNLKISTDFSDVAIPGSKLTINLVNGSEVVAWSNPSTFYLQFATNLVNGVNGFKYASNGAAPATSPFTRGATNAARFYRTINVAP